MLLLRRYAGYSFSGQWVRKSSALRLQGYLTLGAGVVVQAYICAVYSTAWRGLHLHVLQNASMGAEEMVDLNKGKVL